MKNFLWAILAIAIIAVVIFGIWGFVKAQTVRDRAKDLDQLTTDLLVLEEVDPYGTQIPLADWKNLADRSSSIMEEIEKLSDIDESLKQKMNEFFSVKSIDKYREAQYLQLLMNGQEKLNLKNEQPRTKAQIEEILDTLRQTQNEINNKNLSLGPELDQARKTAEIEAEVFMEECNSIAVRMTPDAPPTQLKMANFDKATDELKMAIAQSLNEYVRLQNEIKQEISNLVSSSWINPLSQTSTAQVSR